MLLASRAASSCSGTRLESRETARMPPRTVLASCCGGALCAAACAMLASSTWRPGISLPSPS
eukprot:4450365-Alexandrium_andersonii.AAC.1